MCVGSYLNPKPDTHYLKFCVIKKTFYCGKLLLFILKVISLSTLEHVHVYIIATWHLINFSQ